MDFTTIIAGPAQAGPQTPVSKPGIGLAAGAGSTAADAAAVESFASMVALALDQLDGAASTTGDAPGNGAAEIEVLPGDVEGDDESPLDAPADAATLSLLIALATPGATPLAAPAAPELEVAGQGSPDLAAVASDAAGIVVTASAGAAGPRAAGPLAAAAFDDALATATAAPAAIAPPAAPPEATNPDAAVAPAPAAPIDASADVAAPIGAVASAETPEIPADRTAAVLAQPATTAAPAAETGAAPAPTGATAPRGGQRPAVHPLRQALAAMAAAPADDATRPGQPDATTETPRTAAPSASAPAPAAAGAPEHEGRAGVVSRVAAAVVAPVAPFAAASDEGAAGEGSADAEHGGFVAAASAPTRGAEARLEAAAFPATASVMAEVATAAPLSPLAGFGAAGDTMLRAIEVPAAARFEQTLSTVDPDVRNLQAMVRTVRLFTTGAGVHEARLNLEPDHLGPVALTVRVEQGSVSAHFRAETPAAQRWIETHQQELRAGLREQGLEVKEVVVTTDPDARRDRRQDAQPARPPRARRQQGADAPRFEVLV